MNFAALAVPMIALAAACAAVPPQRASPFAPMAPARPAPPMSYQPEIAGLDFGVDPSVAAPGAAVTLSLHNKTAYQLGYNLCASGLEQLRTGRWQPVPQDGVCTRELRIVAPSQRAYYQTRLPRSLAAGQYRFSTGVETPLNRSTPGLDRIYSRPFTVRR